MAAWERFRIEWRKQIPLKPNELWLEVEKKNEIETFSLDGHRVGFDMLNFA